MVSVGDVLVVLDSPKLRFLKASSGEPVATVELLPASEAANLTAVDSFAADQTVDGQGVVALQYTRHVDASGLTPEQSFVGLQVFDTNGKQIWHSEHALGGHKFDDYEPDAFVDGWIDRRLKPADAQNGNDEWQVLDLQGDAVWAHHFTNLNSTLGHASPKPEEFLGATGHLGLFRDYKITTDTADNITGAYTTLVMRDLAAPQRPLWTSDGIRPPGTGLPHDAFDDRNAPQFLGFMGGKAVLLWPTPTQNAVLALHDPASGHPISAPVPIPVSGGFSGEFGGHDSFKYNLAYDPTSKILVIQVAGAQTAAVDMGNGKVLWRQAADERAFTPDVAGGGVVFGSVGANSDAEGLALDDRTKHERGQVDLGNPVRVVTDNGYALVWNGDTSFWVFQIQHR